MSKLPLEGTRVIDAGNMLAGPFAGKLLGQMGADVIHVEPPWGDDARNTTTEYLGKEGSFYLTANQGKRGIVIDLKSDEGRQVIHRLVETADVFMHNSTGDGAARLGIDYETLSAKNPRLIYGWINGFGSEGAMSKLPGYDVVMQAFVGQVAIHPDNGVPMPGGIVADPSAPLLLAFGIVTALRERDTTGRGQKVETSLLQGAVHMRGAAIVRAKNDPAHAEGVAAKRPKGIADPTTRIMATSDGYLLVSAWSDRQFSALCGLLDLGHLAEDPRFQSRLGRGRYYDELAPIFDGIFQTKPADEWMNRLTSAGVPCSPVHDANGLVAHRQLWDNAMLVETEHPTKGPVIDTGVLIKLSETPGEVRGPAPLFGQHTDEVLREAGYTEDQITGLRATGVVA